FGGAGALLGSLAAPWLQRRIHPKLVVIGSLWLWAITAPALALVPSVLAIGIVWGLTTIAGPVFNVCLSSYRYAPVAARRLARVQSAALVVAWGAVPLGQLTSGLLLEGTGAVTTILAIAGLNLVAAVFATGTRSIRHAPDVKDLLATNA